MRYFSPLLDSCFTESRIFDVSGIDEEDEAIPDAVAGPSGEGDTGDMPPLEGAEEDASRMEEVD